MREYAELAADSPVKNIEIANLPNFNEFPAYEETASTFAENAAGKALHFSHFTDEIVLADDSGLVVPAWAALPASIPRATPARTLQTPIA